VPPSSVCGLRLTAAEGLKPLGYILISVTAYCLLFYLFGAEGRMNWFVFERVSPTLVT